MAASLTATAVCDDAADGVMLGRLSPLLLSTLVCVALFPNPIPPAKV